LSQMREREPTVTRPIEWTGGLESRYVGIRGGPQAHDGGAPHVGSRRETHGHGQGLCRGRWCHGGGRRGGRDIHGPCDGGSVHGLVPSGRRQPSGNARAATAHHHGPALAPGRHGSDPVQRHNSGVPSHHYGSDRTIAPAVFRERRVPTRHHRRASSCAAAIGLDRFGAIVLGFIAPSARRTRPGHTDNIAAEHEPSGACACRTQ